MNTRNNPLSLRTVSAAILMAFAADGYAISPTNALSQTIAGMASGTWAKVNQNTFNSVWTPEDDRVLPGSSYGDNIGGIISAWSGFAWDNNRGDMILYGGGHANYAGNDVYIWHSENLQWERASLPTQIVPTTISGNTQYITVDNGATPQSAHTYDNHVFLPTLDRFLTFGGYSFGPGAPYMKVDGSGNFVTTGPYLFDPSRADGTKVGGADGTGVNPATLGGDMWQNREIYTTSPATTSGVIFGSGLADVTQKAGKDVVYIVANPPNSINGSNLYEYVINDINDPSQDSWTIVGSTHPTTIRDQGAGAYDPVHNIFVQTGFDNYSYHGSPLSLPFLFWDLNTPGTSNAQQSFSVIDNTGGSFSFTDLRSMGLEYDPIGQRFLLWGGGNNVYTLTAPTGGDLTTGWILGLDENAWATGPGGTAANDFPSTGVLGKWHYAEDLGVFVGLKGSTNGDVWVYKPSSTVAAVPLPASIWLFGSALAGFRLFSRRGKTDPKS